MTTFISLPEYLSTQVSTSGELIVLTICLVMFVLIYKSHVIRDRGIILVRRMVILCFFAAAVRVFQIVAGKYFFEAHAAIYALRFMYYILLVSVVLIYTMYIQDPLWANKGDRKRVLFFAGILAIVAIVADTVTSFLGIGYYITNDHMVHVVPGNFFILYCLIMYATVILAVIRSRKNISKRIRMGVVVSAGLSFALVFVQNFFMNKYWLTFSALLVILSVIFLFHTGSYDTLSGAMVEEVLISELDAALRKGRTMHIKCFFVRGLTDHLENSPEFVHAYRSFLRETVKDGLVCRVGDEGIAILFNGPLDTESVNVQSFRDKFDGLKIGYKLVAVETDPSIEKASDYIELIISIRKKIATKASKTADSKDFELFAKEKYILSELVDIYTKRDLNDRRVLAFCQPVLNLATGKYDTAEALMRLTLDKTGIVYPDQFIPLAEKYQTIHVMTMIILNKTCAFIREALKEGHEINRISVNFSMLDFREESFCQEILDIIAENHIPYEKIAIEITESLTSSDLDEIKPKIMMLSDKGIKFYLDDFGTGYSNFERIMELPFQIIKFDRSVVIESAKNDQSRYMVGSLAKMFRHLNYNILFEGIENESDEKNCIDMDAQYLQGYKYSKPIPIYELEKFVS